MASRIMWFKNKYIMQNNENAAPASDLGGLNDVVATVGLHAEQAKGEIKNIVNSAKALATLSVSDCPGHVHRNVLNVQKKTASMIFLRD